MRTEQDLNILDLPKFHEYKNLLPLLLKEYQGLGPIDFNLMKSNFGIMIGNKDFRGCGVGAEVIELIKDFSFKHLQLEKLIFPVVEAYTAAMRLYEKAGFTLNNKVEKTFNKNGKSWKLVECSMTNPFKYKN